MYKVMAMVLASLLLTACAAKHAEQDAQNPTGIKHIIVMPVSIVDTSPADLAMHKKDLSAGKTVLTRLIQDYFIDNDKVSILSEEQAESYNQTYNNNENQQVKEICKRMHADAVMTWNLSRYKEKDGGDYSVNHPASVAFSYRLTDINTGRILCGSRIDQTQQSLTDNLLSAKRFLHRGGKWISAEQLSREIISDKLKECGYLTGDNVQ